MDPNRQRPSNIILCSALVGLGFLFILGTLFLGAYLKPRIIESAREPLNIEGFSEATKLDYFERQIKAKDQSIEFEKRIPDADEFRRKTEEARRKLNKNAGPGDNSLSLAEDKAAKIKRLEDEKGALIAEKDELAGKIRARQMRPRSWGELFEAYNIELLVLGVLPLGFFGFYLLRFLLAHSLPLANPLALTDLERRCVLFPVVTLVFSAFGFLLFVWVLTLIY